MKFDWSILTNQKATGSWEPEEMKTRMSSKRTWTPPTGNLINKPRKGSYWCAILRETEAQNDLIGREREARATNGAEGVVRSLKG